MSSKPGKETEKASHVGPSSILVVEDDIDIRETLTALLSGEGYSVSACSNGLEALNHLRSGKKADIILLDLMMPVMDGWQFRVLQKRDPEIASIPVLAISADGTPKAAAIDADAYLKKPVDYDTLLLAIERILLDLDRRRVNEAIAETERLASLGTLAAGVAHEINNPLAYLMSNITYVTQVLSTDTPPLDELQEARKAIAEAAGGGDRIRAIVRDLALFSRVRDDERRPVSVQRVLDAAANIVMHEIRSYAELVKDYPDDVPRVFGSEARLGQVFLNLLLNAAHAVRDSNASPKQIHIVARADGPWVTVDVRDTGRGIPAEIRSKIFDPFFTTKPVGVGTGLGLSIARNIVRAHGGEISVESESGESSQPRRHQGTIFRVRLPVAAEAQPPREAVAVAAPRQAARRRARILVIDDEEMIGATLGRVLARHYDIVTTTNPDEGVARIREGERFDVILCDMMMPEKSGIDVHAAVARIDPEQAAWMLFLTGGATNEGARKFLSQQSNPVLQKPFVVDELLARIEETLARRDPPTPSPDAL